MNLRVPYVNGQYQLNGVRRRTILELLDHYRHNNVSQRLQTPLRKHVVSNFQRDQDDYVVVNDRG